MTASNRTREHTPPPSHNGNGKHGQAGNDGRGPVFTSAAEFKAGTAEYLWSPRFAFGGLSILDGDTGTGKTAVIFDLIARYTHGREMPLLKRQHKKKKGGDVLLLIERDPSTVLIPRLKAVGADLRRVHFYGRKPGEAFRGGHQLPRLVQPLGQALEQLRCKFLVMDPLTSYMQDGGTTSDTEIRRQLEPLTQMLESLGVLCLATRHLNKREGVSALYRGLGGATINSLTLSVLLCCRHPAKDGRGLLCHVKNSLGAVAPALAYTVEPHDGACRLQWKGEEGIDPDEVLAGDEEQGKRDALGDAVRVLKSCIGGEWVPAKQVIAEAASCGIGERTLRTAKAQLRVPSRRKTYSGDPVWEWGPPPMGWGE